MTPRPFLGSASNIFYLSGLVLAFWSPLKLQSAFVVVVYGVLLFFYGLKA